MGLLCLFSSSHSGAGARPRGGLALGAALSKEGGADTEVLSPMRCVDIGIKSLGVGILAAK